MSMKIKVYSFTFYCFMMRTGGGHSGRSFNRMLRTFSPLSYLATLFHIINQVIDTVYVWTRMVLPAMEIHQLIHKKLYCVCTIIFTLKCSSFERTTNKIFKLDFCLQRYSVNDPSSCDIYLKFRFLTGCLSVTETYSGRKTSK